MLSAITSVIVGGILFVNVLVYTNGNMASNFNLLKAKAQSIELPEVEITCDSGGDGTCYEEDLPAYLINVQMDQWVNIPLVQLLEIRMMFVQQVMISIRK